MSNTHEDCERVIGLIADKLGVETPRMETWSDGRRHFSVEFLAEHRNLLLTVKGIGVGRFYDHLVLTHTALLAKEYAARTKASENDC